MKKNKKRNAQDATLRNIRAANKEHARLVQWCKALTEDVARLFGRVEALEKSQEQKRKGRKI